MVNKIKFRRKSPIMRRKSKVKNSLSLTRLGRIFKIKKYNN